MPEPLGMQSGAHATRLYRGGCQCGAVHYEVSLDLSCPSERGASVWEYFVEPQKFRLLIGDESLSGYQFFAEDVHHFFCVRCGVRTFSHHLTVPDNDAYAIDIRTLHSHAKSDGFRHRSLTRAARLD